MKKYLTIVLFGVFFITSCSDPFLCREGIYLDFHNYTNEDYKDVVFYIGAVKDGKFLKTDSLISRPVASKKYFYEWIKEYKELELENYLRKDEKGIEYAFSAATDNRTPLDDEGGWMPNYDTIRKLSDYFTYKIKLSNDKKQREQVFMSQKKMSVKANNSRRKIIIKIKKDTIILKDIIILKE